jgi:hypothetical protein
VFLPVDNDGGDLLVHEEEDGEQDRGDARQQVHVPINQYSQASFAIIETRCHLGKENPINVFLFWELPAASISTFMCPGLGLIVHNFNFLV